MTPHYTPDGKVLTQQINLPFGAIAIGTVAFYFKAPKRKSSGLTTKEKILEIDLVGAVFLICAIVCLLLALQWGGSKYPWHDSKVWGCLLGFGLLIALFIAQQFRRGERATIPPRIFGQRTVLFACLYSAFMSMGLYVSSGTLLLPTKLYRKVTVIPRHISSTCPFTSRPSKEPRQKAPVFALSRILRPSSFLRSS